MEGPSIVILVEEAQKFIGQRVKECAGSSKVIDPKALCGQKLMDLKSWGKHFLLIFELNANIRRGFMHWQFRKAASGHTSTKAAR
ncbi:MAG TPA: hypothetical protein VI479_17600 [Blastocatellia bacterium]